MKFFDGIRPQIYIYGAKLKRDKKTGKRLWALTLIVTLKPELLGAIATWMSIDFYALAEDRKPALRVQGVDLEGLRLTRDAETVELWFQFEVENSATVHPFMKEYAFTRLWADFKQRKEEIAAEQAKAVEKGK